MSDKQLPQSLTGLLKGSTDPLLLDEQEKLRRAKIRAQWAAVIDAALRGLPYEELWGQFEATVADLEWLKLEAEERALNALPRGAR
jgi:hypothetical protein